MFVVANNVTTYASHTPYLTFDEWNTAATAIDIRDLIPGGTTAQQQMAVQNSIERASSWVDRICHTVLAATTDTHSGRFLVNRWGNVRIPLPRKPVLEVSVVMVGSRPSTMTALASLVDADIGPTGVLDVPVMSWTPPTASPDYGYGGIGPGSRPLVAVTYVNGFPNTSLTSTATAGASTVTVANSLGVYPGTGLTIYDVTSGAEQVTVAPSFVAGSTSVPLVSPLVYTHAAGISVSNLPPVVKEATILLTSALIQTRGDDAIVLDSMDSPAKVSGGYGANAEAEYLAGELLADLVRVR